MNVQTTENKDVSYENEKGIYVVIFIIQFRSAFCL